MKTTTMPRKRKTATGASAQPVAVAAGGAYGTRQTSEQAQQAVPLAGASSGGTPAVPRQTAADVALAHPPPQGVPLSAPSQFPDEPFTAGLPVGPGAGPNPLSQFRNDPLLPAAAVLNQLGDDVDEETARFRAVLNAHVGNSGAI